MSRFGRRAGKTLGSCCAPSKVSRKSTVSHSRSISRAELAACCRRHSVYLQWASLHTSNGVCCLEANLVQCCKDRCWSATPLNTQQRRRILSSHKGDEAGNGCKHLIAGQFAQREEAPHGCWGIVILGAKVAVTVDEGQAHGEGLCKPNKCVVDCRVTMRMVLAEHLSNDPSRLPARHQGALPAIPAAVARDPYSGAQEPT